MAEIGLEFSKVALVILWKKGRSGLGSNDGKRGKSGNLRECRKKQLESNKK